MKTAKYIALILMSVLLIATLVVGGILANRVLTLLSPATPQLNTTEPSSSSTVVPTVSSTVPTTAPPVTIHQCEYTIPGDTVAPTCDMLGYTEYFCQCGESEFSDYVDALNHSYGEYTVIPHTCTTEGWTERTCSRCHQTERMDIVEAKHSFTSWTPSQLPDRETRTCTACGTTRLRSTVSGENWTLELAKPEARGEYIHIKVTVTPSKDDDSYVQHIYLASGDIGLQLDYSQSYLLIHYTINGVQRSNAIAWQIKSVTLLPDGTVIPEKPENI